MAKPATGAPKGNNLVLFLLWTTTILFGYQMFFNKPKDERPVGDLLKVMREQNAKLLDQSIVTTRSAYENKINDDEKAKRLTKDGADAARLEAAVLVADTQLKAGLARNETSRLRAAYNTLWPFEKKKAEHPGWPVQTVAVADTTNDPRFGWKAWNGQALFDRTGDLLSARNRHELVWGFLPGGYAFIDALVAATGRVPSFSYAFAALLLAFVVRLLVFPFSQKQLMFSRQMNQLSPLVKQVADEYKDDPQQKQAKTMELYKEYGLNPAAGCAPALVQIPLTFTVYQCMLLYQFEFQKGTFLWMNPASNRASHGFFAANLGQMDTILIVLYGISMIVTTMLTPINDPSQARQQRMLGIGAALIFTFFMFTGMFPVVAGFVLYWTFTNVFSTLQSLRAYRLPLAPLVKVNAKGGGVFPLDALRAAAQRPNGASPNGPPSNGSAPKGSTGKPAQHRPKKRK